MLKRLTLSALLGSALALAAADVTLPCAFAAGQLTRFDRTAEALPFVDFDKAAALAAASDEEVALDSLSLVKLAAAAPHGSILLVFSGVLTARYRTLTTPFSVPSGRDATGHSGILLTWKCVVSPST